MLISPTCRRKMWRRFARPFSPSVRWNFLTKPRSAKSWIRGRNPPARYASMSKASSLFSLTNVRQSITRRMVRVFAPAKFGSSIQAGMSNAPLREGIVRQLGKLRPWDRRPRRFWDWQSILNPIHGGDANRQGENWKITPASCAHRSGLPDTGEFQ